jgi:hypothetical protein
VQIVSRTNNLKIPALRISIPLLRSDLPRKKLPPTPRHFFSKSVILGELTVIFAQECDLTGFRLMEHTGATCKSF